MTRPTDADVPDLADPDVAGGFRDLRWLTDHWSRPVAPRSYYWYLTFEESADLHAVVRRCQRAIAFPYYDLTPPDKLHLTLDRVAFHDDITPAELRGIEANATRLCRQVPALDITLGALGGTASAVGFTAFPPRSIQNLFDTLRTATLSVCPEAPVKPSAFHPHVAIAYANSDNVRAAQVTDAVEEIRTTTWIDVTVDEAALVLLERRRRSYAWEVISRVPLSG